MSAYADHQDVRPAYVTPTDPGAVGAGILWVDTSGGTGAWSPKIRNNANSGWESLGSSGGFASPMTTPADLIVGGTAGAAVRLAKGSDGQVLTVDPTTHLLLWATPTVYSTRPANPMTTPGDLLLGGTAGVETRLPKGADSTVLAINPSSHLPDWLALAAGRADNPMTTPGDLILGGTAGAEGRLAKGADSTQLTVDPTTHLPVWAVPVTPVTTNNYYGDLVKLSEVVVSSAGVTSVDFSGIPATYRDLVVVALVRSDAAGVTSQALTFRINNDSGANYHDEELVGFTSTVVGDAAVGQTVGRCGAIIGASGSANRAGVSHTILPNYTRTDFHKTWRAGYSANYSAAAGGQVVGDLSGVWASTVAVNRLTFGLGGGGNFVVGSIIAIYGQGPLTPTALPNITMPGDLVKLDEVILSASSATIDFLSIPQTYRHLKVVASARSDGAGVTSHALLLRFNNDSGANYSDEEVYGSNTTIGGNANTGQTTGRCGAIVGAAATASRAGQSEILIANYTRTDWHKVWRGDAFAPRSTAAGDYVQDTLTGLWSSTAAITRITFSPGGGGNFVAGTVISLYGIQANGAGGIVASTLQQTGTLAARSAAGSNGNVHLPTDGIAIARDSGSAWVDWGPIWPLTKPVDSQFAWVNQGTASVVVDDQKITLKVPGAAGTNFRWRGKSAPSTPYTVTVLLRGGGYSNVPRLGIGFRNAAGGGIACLMVDGTTGYSCKFTSATAFSAVYTSWTCYNWSMNTLLWLRIADDGTNRICSVSSDGYNWVVVHTIGRTDFITADQIGFFIDPNAATTEHHLTVLSWKEA